MFVVNLEVDVPVYVSANSDDSSVKKRSSKDKPMKAADFQRVEYELQRHLQTGRMEHHMAHMSPQTAMFMQEDIMMESIGQGHAVICNHTGSCHLMI